MFACSSLFWVTQAKADIVQITPIDFGEIAIISNNAVSTLSMDYLGNLSFSNAIRIIRPGSPGEYLVTGFAGNVELSITTQILGAVMNPGQVSPEYPTLASLSAPATIRTESDGTAVIYLGGSIQTSGSGNNGFVDATYTASLQVTINF
ncbi:MAG: hypothetical protein ACJAVV_001265 [Alphaproteobacteria bacterium]|jgi:hypothetical protein